MTRSEPAGSLRELAARDPAFADTPLLTVDVDAVDRNIARLQAYCDRHGLACRPHVKTHKLPPIAHRQLAAGAAGVTCQKLGEAEVMVAAGVSDILLSYPILGERKATRFAALAGEARMAAVGDSAQVARGLSAALVARGATARFLVECDTGLGRTGVQTPEEAAALAELVASLPGLQFAGLMTYPTSEETPARLRAAREAIEARGLSVDVLSGGGTPNAWRSHELGEITELRAGTYVYGDRACIADGSVAVEDCALRVLATVVSRPTPGRAIIDAGSKALTNDGVAGGAATGFGLVLEHPEAELYLLNEEHGYVDVSRCAQAPAIGDVVTLIPNHACGATNLYDTVLAHRGGKVLGEWTISARGRVR